MDSTELRILRFKQQLRLTLLVLALLGAGFALFLHLQFRYTSLTLFMQAPENISYSFRCNGRSIERLEGDAWKKFVTKGVELDYNQNQADYETYSRWLSSLRELNANAVRVHALMPADFYRALYDLNQTGEPLYLIQGIELSEESFAAMEDMVSGDMVGQFLSEGRQVMDAVHGNRLTRGYRSDVSDYTLAYILGDKWDPQLVLYTDRKEAALAGSYQGRYAEVWDSADATATLLAQTADGLFAYETVKYGQQHLLGIGNSQETDLLFHDTSWAIGLNENIAHVSTAHIVPTALVKTGVFAALRVDTGLMQNMSFDPAYTGYTDPSGRSNPLRYYLDTLYNAHRIPLMLGGTSMSAARGVSGLDELKGYDRGGVGEESQAAGLGFAYEQALEVGFCGGCVGYYLDNPLRTAWNREQFALHGDSWLDAQDSEQSLGLVALEPGGAPLCVVDGDPSEWEGAELLSGDGRHSLQAMGDEKYLYLHLHVDDLNAQRDVIYVAFDVTPLSGAWGSASQELDFDRCMDFLLTINGKRRAKLTVQEYYDETALIASDYMERLWFMDPPDADSQVFADIRQYVRPYLVDSGMHMTDAAFSDAGLLGYGSGDEASRDYDALADYYISGEELELRIPWALLNFKDPSKGIVMGDMYLSGNSSLEIEQIDMSLAVYQDGEMAQFSSGELELPCYESAAYRERLRPAYYAVRELFE